MIFRLKKFAVIELASSAYPLQLFLMLKLTKSYCNDQNQEIH